METGECDNQSIIMFIIIQIVFSLVFFLLFCNGRRCDSAPEPMTAIDFTGTACLVNDQSRQRASKKNNSAQDLQSVLSSLQKGERVTLTIHPN